MALIESNDKELKVSHWFYSHFTGIKKTLFSIFIAVDIIIVGVTLILFVSYIVGIPKYNTMLQELADQRLDFTNYKEQFPLEELVVLKTIALRKDSNTYTAVAKIKNPNEDWIATEITYTFKMPGLESEERTGFAYPEETKVLSLSGISYASSNATLPNTTLEIKDVKWKRKTNDIDAIIIPNFSIQDLNHKIVNTSKDETAETLITRVTAKTQNDTIYSFWNVKVHVLVNGTGGDITNYKTINLSEYLSLEQRDAQVIWTEALFGVKSVEMYLEADTIDGANIITIREANKQPN